MFAKGKKWNDGRGEFLTVDELAKRTGRSIWTVYYRLCNGISPYAPHRDGHGRPRKTLIVDGVETTYEAVAKAEGITVNAVRQRVHRGLLASSVEVLNTPRQRAAEYRNALNGEEIIDRRTPYEEDDRCWYVTACHPSGITLEEVGTLLNCTRERVRQIEEKALRKLRSRGVSREDLLRMKHAGDQLSELRDRKESRFNPAASGVYYVLAPTAMPTVVHHSGRKRSA